MTVVIDTIGGNCPVQAEGTVNGKPFYFRARHNHWSMSIGGADVIGDPEWYYCQNYGDNAAGCMEEQEARKFILMTAGFFEMSEADETREAPVSPVDKIVDQLDKRLISQPDRTRLGRALDRANAPQAGRAGADEALGRAIR